MPLPSTVTAAIAALPSAVAIAAAQSTAKPDRIIDAYLHRRPLPRSDAHLKQMQRQQRRAQRLAELDALPVSERYGTRFNARAGLWILYIDNFPAASSADVRALEQAYPELLHQHLVEVLQAVHHDKQE